MTKKLLSMILTAATALGVCAAEREYKREDYDIIIERSPFGEDPVSIQATAAEKKQTAAAAAAQRKLQAQIRLCYLSESETGEIRAGFHNKAAKTGESKSIMLMLGDNFQGMKLQSVDLDTRSATLLVNGKPIEFVLTKAAAKAAPAKRVTTTSSSRRLGTGFRRTEPEKKVEPKVVEEKPQLTPEEQAARREQIRADLQDYQMEVIRQGMPALPIPLTQEMDDQLVAEGVLEPVAQPEE